MVLERDSLLAFSLLLKNSIAAMASTSSTSSTICQILLLEFIERPPCVYTYLILLYHGILAVNSPLCNFFSCIFRR